MANDLIISDGEMAVVKQCQSIMQTSYDDRVLVNSIVSQIALPDPKKCPDACVNMADVLQIVRLASSMHLDPILGGIWGFKDKNNHLVCGISKKGWQQALNSQPDFFGLSFKHDAEMQSKKIGSRDGSTTLVNYYPSITCVIKKIRKDGSIGEFEGTAYFDEEFDPSKPTWLQRPKRMLESRALTIAASNAYGWGAYDQEEVQNIPEMVEAQAVVVEKPKKNRAAVALENKENKDKAELIDAMKRTVNRAELVRVFKGAPDNLKKDPEVVQLSKEIAKSFEKEEL